MRVTHDRVERIDTDHGPGWMVHSTWTYDDGSTDHHRHAFLADIFEGRAAEYGIDDIDTLIQIVLWEPHLHLLGDGVDHTHPMFVWNAPTIGHAREFHLRRITTVKAVLADPDQDAAVLDVLRAEHGIDPDVLALRREHFELERQAHQQATRAAESDRRKLWAARVEEARCPMSQRSSQPSSPRSRP